MGRPKSAVFPKSMVFTDNGKTASISVDGAELQNVTSISIYRDATWPTTVEVVQRFYPETLSANIEGAELNLKKEAIDNG